MSAEAAAAQFSRPPPLSPQQSLHTSSSSVLQLLTGAWLMLARSLRQVAKFSAKTSCGGGDLGGQCASNSQIHNFINPNNHFERYRPLQAVNSAQRLLLCLNFQFNLAAPRARLRAR
jgi:hypothetical protein